MVEQVLKYRGKVLLCRNTHQIKNKLRKVLQKMKALKNSK
jgi:hypothetical protein